MTRSFRWPMLAVCLGVGLAAGRYVELPTVQGDSTVVASAIPAEMTSYRGVVKQVLPAVVSIESRLKAKKGESSTTRRAQPQPDMSDVPEDLRRLLPDLRRMQPDMPREQALGFGSGFIVNPAGVILTNNHVVDGASEVVVTLTDGRKFTSSDIKTDAESDIAIVRIKAAGKLPFLRFADSSLAEIGDRVLAIGAPFGLTGSVTHGIISGRGRALDRRNRYDDYLQTDAAINPGNSGGPLVNLAGEVVGVNAAIKSRSGGFEGIGLAVTSNTARNVVEQLQTNGTVKRPYLGVEMAGEISSEVAARLGMKDGQGVVVTRVVPNSPAAKAGIKADDVIMALNGHAIHDNRTLLQTVLGLPIGKAADVEVMRDGQSKKLTLTLEEQPKGYGERTVRTRGGRVEGESIKVEKFGLELADVPADRAEAFGIKSGALVVGVEPDGAAAEAGIVRGLAITRVDRKDVNSAEAAKQAIEKGDAAKGVLLHLRAADGGTAIVLLKADK
jgi:serine protease Do